MSVAIPQVRMEIFRGPPKLFDDNFVKGWTLTSGGSSAFSTDGDIATLNSGDQYYGYIEKEVSFSTDIYPKIAVRIAPDSEDWGLGVYYGGAWHNLLAGQTETGLKEVSLIAGLSITKIRLISWGTGKVAKFDYIAISKQSVLIPVDETKSDIVESLTITRPILSRGVGGFSCKLPNMNGEYTDKINDFDHVLIYLWRKGATMKKVFGGKILLPGTEGFGSSGEYYLLLAGMDIGQELIAPPALLEKYYEGVNGKAIIEDAIDLCSELTKKFVDVDNEIASTHDFEFQKVKPYKVINEICIDAKTSGGVVGFDGYVDPAGNVHIFKRDKYLSPVDLTGIIEHYKKEDDAHRVRNKIYVFGEATKPFPLNKDTWTDWTNPQNKSDLTSDAASGQKVVNVADGSIFSVGDKVLIIDNNNNEHNEIESINVNQLTMKNNLAHTYTTAANAFVEILPGWLSGTGTGSISADATEKIFGDRSVKLNVTGSDYYGNAWFELDEVVNCNLYPSLTFQIKAESAYCGDITIRLTDEAGMTVRKELKIRLGEWNLFQFKLGRKHSNEWTHSLFNSQDFDWEKVIRAEIFCHFSGVGTGAFWIDNLFFNHRRWSAVAEDSTSQAKYGTRCNDPIIEDMLKSDSECQKRADGILEFLKDKVTTLRNFRIEGNNGFTPGDKQLVVISNDNINENFRILEVHHVIKGMDWTTKLTLTNEPALIDYVFKEIEKRLDRLERRTPIAAGVTGETGPVESAEKKALAYNKKTGVKPGTETVLVSYSVAANQSIILHGFLAWGTCQAVYRLYVGTTVKISFVTSEAFRMVPADVLRENVNGPATIQVKVLHYIPAPGVDDYHDFEGTILGRPV